MQPGQGLPLPLLVNVSSSMQASKDGSTVVIVGVRVALMPHGSPPSAAPAPAAGKPPGPAPAPPASPSPAAPEPSKVSVRLSCPALFGKPVRVAPSGAHFDASSTRLAWEAFPKEMLKLGEAAVAVGVFKVPAGTTEEECAAAARQLVADVEVEGAPGGARGSGSVREKGVLGLHGGVLGYFQTEASFSSREV
jgi:hypothetical protein